MTDEELRMWAVDHAARVSSNGDELIDAADKLVNFVRSPLTPYGESLRGAHPIAGSSAGDHFDAELARQVRELDEEPQGA